MIMKRAINYIKVLLFCMVIGGDLTTIASGAAPSKYSPILQAVLQNEKQSIQQFQMKKWGISYSTDSQIIYHLLVRTEASLSELTTQGYPVQTLIGGIATVSLTKDRIPALARRKDIQSIELAVRRPPLLDISTQSGYTTISNQTVWMGIGARSLQSLGHTGRGVIIGDIDSGIDYTHGDFLSSPSTSRILYIWDQTDDTTTIHPNGFMYGREYTNAEINQQLVNPDTTLVEQTDNDYHGTAVMGVAAGNGQGTGNGVPAGQFIGVAPEAGIIMVKTDFYDSQILDGIHYIFSRASSLGLPSVVNLSLGSHYGPHDGSSTFETAIDSSLGPGRMLVAAAGNNGSVRLHARMINTSFSWDTLLISIPAGQPDIDLDIWHDGKDIYHCILQSPTGTEVSCYAYSQSSSDIGGGIAGIYNQTFQSPNGEGEIFITLSGLTENGIWKLLCYREITSIGTGILDAWSANQVALFNNHTTLRYTVIEPGHAKRVLTVGAYVTRNTWTALDGTTYSYPSIPLGQRAGFSSIGPSRDDTRKPEICAPGQNIATAQSSFAANTSQRNAILPDGKHRIVSGTSFSAPHGAGVAALLLQDNPLSTPEEIKTRIINGTYREDYYANPIPDPEYRWGYGKLNLRGIIPTGILSRYWMIDNYDSQ